MPSTTSSRLLPLSTLATFVSLVLLATICYLHLCASAAAAAEDFETVGDGARVAASFFPFLTVHVLVPHIAFVPLLCAPAFDDNHFIEQLSDLEDEELEELLQELNDNYADDDDLMQEKRASSVTGIPSIPEEEFVFAMETAQQTATKILANIAPLNAWILRHHFSFGLTNTPSVALTHLWFQSGTAAHLLGCRTGDSNDIDGW